MAWSHEWKRFSKGEILSLSRQYTKDGQTFFVYGPNFIKILYCRPEKNLFGLFFFKFDIIDVNFVYFSSINVSQIDTGAAENLWRAALWPPLPYTFVSTQPRCVYGLEFSPRQLIAWVIHLKETRETFLTIICWVWEKNVRLFWFFETVSDRIHVVVFC